MTLACWLCLLFLLFYICVLIGVEEITPCCLTKMVLVLEVDRALLRERTPLWVCSGSISASKLSTQTLTMVRYLLHNTQIKTCPLEMSQLGSFFLFFFFGIYLILLGFGVKTSCWNTHYFLCCCLISLMIWHRWCLWDMKCFQLWAYDLIKKAELLSQAWPPLICGYKTKTVALTRRMGLHVAAAQIVLSLGRLAPLTLGGCTSEDSCSFPGCLILFVPGTRELRTVPQ